MKDVTINSLWLNGVVLLLPIPGNLFSKEFENFLDHFLRSAYNDPVAAVQPYASYN